MEISEISVELQKSLEGVIGHLNPSFHFLKLQKHLLLLSSSSWKSQYTTRKSTFSEKCKQSKTEIGKGKGRDDETAKRIAPIPYKECKKKRKALECA